MFDDFSKTKLRKIKVAGDAERKNLHSRVEFDELGEKNFTEEISLRFISTFRSVRFSEGTIIIYVT